MDSQFNLLTFAFVSLLAVISPGPDFLIVVKNSLSYSRKAGMFTALGISVALLIHLSYTLIGASVLMSEGSLFYLTVKYAGAGYLFYIGYKGFVSSFKKQPALDLCLAEGYSGMIASSSAFKQGFLTNLLNPKCALFFLSFFSQFITNETTTLEKIGYGSLNWVIALGWFLFLSYLLTGKMTERLTRFRMHIDRVMGCALMLLALKLMWP